MPKQNTDAAVGWLKKRAEYQACYEQGQRFYTTHFVVFVLPKESGFCRAGIAVSKKVGTAVVRNRYKRVVRAFFRLNASILPRPIDVVLVVKKQSPKQTDFHTVCDQLIPFFSSDALKSYLFRRKAL